MTEQTEAIVRTAAKTDPSVSETCLELAIRILKGEPLAPPPPPPDELNDIVPYDKACRLLHVGRTGLHKFIRRKRLVRVMGTGGRGIGVTRKSILRVMEGYVTNGHR